MVGGEEFGHDVVDFAVDELALVIAEDALGGQVDLVHDARVFAVEL